MEEYELLGISVIWQFRDIRVIGSFGAVYLALPLIRLEDGVPSERVGTTSGNNTAWLVCGSGWVSEWVVKKGGNGGGC